MSETEERTRRTDARADILAAIGLIVIACAYVAFPHARPDLTRFNCDDSEAYIGLANSIAAGRGYTRCLNPEQYLPHKTWPPGLPLLIAAVIEGFGLNLLPIKLLMVVIGLVGLLFLYLLVRRIAGPWPAAWTMIAVGCSAHYVWFSHQVMPAVPLFTVSVVVLWMIDRTRDDPLRWRWWALAGLIAGYGGLIKGLALLLVPSAGLVLLRVSREQRRRTLVRFGLFATLAVVPMLGWSLRNSRVQAQSMDGVNQFRMLLQQSPNDPNSKLITPRSVAKEMYANIAWGLLYNLPNQTVPLLHLADLRERQMGRVVALALTPLLLVAFLASAWQRLRPIHIYAALMLGLLTVFSTGGTARYFLPLAPLFLCFLASAIRGSGSWQALGNARWALAALWLVLSAADLCVAIHKQQTMPYADEQWMRYERIARRAPSVIPDDATVCVHNPNAFTLLSGLRTWITQPGVPFDLLGALRSGRITHVVVSKGDRLRDKGRRAWVQEHRRLLRRIAENDGYEILAYVGATTTSRGAPDRERGNRSDVKPQP